MRNVTIKAHLFSYVCLKVLISCNVHADTPVLQSSRGDFIRSTWYGRNYDVRKREAPRKVERGWHGAHNVTRVERAASCCCFPSFLIESGRGGPLGVLLYRIDIDREDASAIVREE